MTPAPPKFNLAEEIAKAVQAAKGCEAGEAPAAAPAEPIPSNHPDEQCDDPVPAGPPPAPAGPLPPALVKVEFWRAKFLALDPLDAPRGCRGFPQDAWRRVHREIRHFLDQTASPCWGRIAVECDWDEIALFGCHPVVGLARFDTAGALLLNFAGQRITQVLPALIRYASGVAAYRVPAHPMSIPIWDFKEPAP
jgi:hypothetical protein